MEPHASIASSVRYARQENDFYCGPAVVQMILSFFGKESSQSELGARLHTDATVGTRIGNIEQFLAETGISYRKENNTTLDMLAQAVTAGNLVVVGYRELEENVPHYALASNLFGDEIQLLDPWHGEDFVLPLSEFLARWTDDENEAYGQRMMLVIEQ